MRSGWLAVIALAAVASAVLLRYELQAPAGSTSRAYVLDRWTGQVHVIFGATVQPAEPPPPRRYLPDDFTPPQEDEKR